MARATTKAWMGIVTAMALAGTSAVWATPPALVGLTGGLGQTPPRPANAHAALNSGIESYKKSDYEAAATYFAQALANQDDLSSEERQELNNLMRVNTAAVQQQQDGRNRLQLAEQAAYEGRISDAESQLKIISVYQFLSAEDKIKAQRLAEALNSGGGRLPAVTPGTNSSAGVMARNKLQQARNLMARGNYEAAELLAHEVEKMNVSFRDNGEDTPRKVLSDLTMARAPKDAKGLLTAARTALQKGDLDSAERLAHQSERAASALTWYPWGDNPSKLLKDVQQARLRVALENSRKSYQQSGTKESSAVVPAHAVSQEEIVSAKPTMGKMDEAALPTDPHALLKTGREMYDSGNLDEAEKIARRAKAAGPTSWGLFKDSPDGLLKDIYKARTQRNKEESVRLMAEARRKFEQGQYDEAKAMAYKAEELHGSYGLLDFGDRPMKLIAEIESAQAKAPKTKVVPVPPELVKPKETEKLVGPMSRAPEKPAAALMPRADSAYQIPQPTGGSYQIPTMADNNGSSAGTNSTPANRGAEDSRTAQARRMLAEAHYHVRQGNLEKALALVVQVEGMGVNLDWAGEDSPLVIRREIETRLSAGRPANAASVAAAPPAPESPAKQQARQILGEARRLQDAGDLEQARAKVLEALKLGVTFAPNEDGPDKALLQLSQIVGRRIDGLLQEATDNVVTGNADPSRYRRAEEALVQARRLATGFALDVQPIDAKFAWMRQVMDRAQGNMPPVLQTHHQEFDYAATGGPSSQEPSASPVKTPNKGEELLDKARLELRRGDIGMARRLAVEAYNGPYGVQAHADAVLHSIDVEEISQRTNTANRTFEAGLGYYQRRDYAQAALIFRSVDANLLTPDKQARLRDLMLTPEMQPAGLIPVALKGTGQDNGQPRVSDLPGQPKKSPLEESYAQQVQALQEVQFQKLRDQGLQVQREAIERFQAGETDRALQMLQEYLASLRESQLEPQRVALLRRPVENRLQNFKVMKAQQDFDTQRNGDAKSFNELRARQAKAEEHKQKLVEEQMKLYHTAYKEARYAEAEMHAKRAHELDPDNAQASAAVYVSEMMRNHHDFEEIKERKERMVISALDNAEDPGPAVDSNNPLYVDKERSELAKRRKMPPAIEFNTHNEREREIERKLTLPISLDFKNTPMSQVIDDLRAYTQMNIVVDKPALEEEQHNLEMPVTMKLEGVTTKSALNLLLHLAHLTYVVEDEVLKITTESHSKGRTILKVYQVADLVIPIMNSTGAAANPIAAMQQNGLESRSMATGGAGVWQGPHSLPGGKEVSGSLQNSMSSTSNVPSGTNVAKSNSPTAGLEDTLMKLITNMIKPESWESMGGPGSIDYWPLGMALAIQQTPDIQEQIQELLSALRRLQDIEVAVEVKFITIAESYFERIGMDFNINIETNNTKFEPMVVSQQFQPFGFINEPDPKGVVVGLQPTGQFTNSLDIPITNNSFNLAVPPFGAYPNMPGADGGLSLGLAFLSDIQVFLFMEAAQGDRRTNVMQAPKLTMFNGQTATLTILDTQFFVTDVTFFLVNGQVVFFPVNTPFATGVAITIAPVVTADRRFVRMSLAPTITNTSTPTTALFPVTAFITPLFEGGAQGQPVPFTMFLQQPAFTTIAVMTTVMVPDGGTVLMGGLKTLSEGRNEYGPPILSKLPYFNRLFKNVGYGRDAQSLLIMVTPRIIINAEEEYRQTGEGQAPTPGEVQQAR